MTDAQRRAGLIEAIGRKNRLDPPLVSPVRLEVRTAIGFTLSPKQQVAQLLSLRKGASVINVVWQFKVPDERLHVLKDALRDLEPDLMKKTASAPVRYLGTHVIQERPDDEPVFVAVWGCAGVEAAAPVASETKWVGPANAAAEYGAIFGHHFDRASAHVTSQGLAAAIAD